MVGVTLAEHVELAPVPETRVHDTAVPGVNVTVPVGATAPVVAMSVTVAVQLVESRIVNVDGMHATPVMVGLAPTVTVA